MVAKGSRSVRWSEAIRTGCAHRIQTGAGPVARSASRRSCAADCLLLLMQLGGITRLVIPFMQNSGNQIYRASTKTWGPKRMTMNGR